MDNKRYYNFILVIYEDDKLYKQQMANLQINYESIYIRHDKDIDEEGKTKKPHYHFVIRLKNAKTISALAKESLVEPHMIEPVKKSFDGALRYLIHFNRDDKYQYDPSEVKSIDEKLMARFIKSVNQEMSEEEKVEKIEDFIDNATGVIEMNRLEKYVRKINKWDAFRRNQSYFRAILDEHNRKYARY